MVEGLRYVLAKRVACTTRRDSPATAVIGVRPQEVAHGTFVRNFLDSVKGSDIVECVDARGETSVEAEDLVVDESGERKVVEKIGEVFPHVRISVLSEAFIVEAVHLGDLTRLVVATKDGNPLWVSDFQGHKKGHCLDGVVSTVNVVA